MSQHTRNVTIHWLDGTTSDFNVSWVEGLSFCLILHRNEKSDILLPYSSFKYAEAYEFSVK